jgi:hypothetical protein
MKEVTTAMNAENQRASARSQQLFHETQWVYGHIGSEPLPGFSTGSNHMKTIQKYREDSSTTTMSPIAKKGESVILLYPMEKVDITPTHFQYTMRCKTVNKETGQLSVFWVIVYEDIDGKEKRYVKEFSLTS